MQFMGFMRRFNTVIPFSNAIKNFFLQPFHVMWSHPLIAFSKANPLNFTKRKNVA